jgi:WS/DGAT C-terminal domain/Wax ester synthase-like Acyl-CoA acyltransferase domain
MMAMTLPSLQALLENDRNRWILGLALVPATVALYYWQQQRTKRKLKRTVSFTSFGLAVGTFPEQAKVPVATINTACYFADFPPSVEAIAEQIVEPLLQYERMSNVLDMTTGCFRPSSRSYQPKDLVRELDITSNDETLTNRTIFEHLQDVLVRDDLPWWEILVVKNKGKGPSALVIRVHHTLADGLALVHAFQNILTKPDGSPIQTLATTSRKPPPSKQNKNFLAIAWSLIEATVHVLTLGATKHDDDTAFSKCNYAEMKHTGKREFVIFPTVPLDFIKELKTASNCTVNDILTTAVSQAIHDYCRSQKDPVLDEKGIAIQCRALLPVGFPRSPDELRDSTAAMRNKWCMASCDIALGCGDIMERLATVHANTTEMKEKPRAVMQLMIQNAIPPLLPKSVSRQTVMDVFSRHSLVLTNVPGPNQACALAGKTIQGVQLFFNNILTQVDLLSYAGQVFGNIVYDHEALPDFQDFGRLYACALVQLAERLQVTPPRELLSATKA